MRACREPMRQPQDKRSFDGDFTSRAPCMQTPVRRGHESMRLGEFPSTMGSHLHRPRLGLPACVARFWRAGGTMPACNPTQEGVTVLRAFLPAWFDNDALPILDSDDIGNDRMDGVGARDNRQHLVVPGQEPIYCCLALDGQFVALDRFCDFERTRGPDLA